MMMKNVDSWNNLALLGYLKPNIPFPVLPMDLLKRFMKFIRQELLKGVPLLCLLVFEEQRKKGSNHKRCLWVLFVKREHHESQDKCVWSLVTQPMMQHRPNQMELRSMDSYIQILCRFQKCKQKVSPPSLPCTLKSPFTPPRMRKNHPLGR